jgi:glycosyltransferase involved in cell wall biosynthesis
MTYTANKPDSLINIETLQLENYYRGKRLVLSEKTVYDAKEEKFVTECTGAANPVYRYQETKFQNDYPENLLVEHTNFTTQSNWKGGALASKYEIDENTLLYVTVGRLNWFKGWKFMIDCFEKLDSPLAKFVFIGDGENKFANNSAFIFRPLTVDGKVIGAIDVFGPSRMDYSKVISTVEYLTQKIAGIIEGKALPEPGEE